MYTQRIEFDYQSPQMSDSQNELAIDYLNALRMNGQTCGNEWSTFYEKNRLIAIVSTPERASLAQKNHGKYVKKIVSEGKKSGMTIRYSQLSDSVDGASACQCVDPHGYILYADYVCLASPVRCLDCFGQIPLYRLPCMPSGDYHELISWQSDFQSCDRLQMNCTVLERASILQLSKPDSHLSKKGRENCQILAGLTNKPFYYYLFRGHNGKSAATEKERTCPVCKALWYLESPLHSIFRFKCDPCRLLSNFAWNLE